MGNKPSRNKTQSTLCRKKQTDETRGGSDQHTTLQDRQSEVDSDKLKTNRSSDPERMLEGRHNKVGVGNPEPRVSADPEPIVHGKHNKVDVIKLETSACSGQQPILQGGESKVDIDKHKTRESSYHKPLLQVGQCEVDVNRQEITYTNLPEGCNGTFPPYDDVEDDSPYVFYSETGEDSPETTNGILKQLTYQANKSRDIGIAVGNHNRIYIGTDESDSNKIVLKKILDIVTTFELQMKNNKELSKELTMASLPILKGEIDKLHESTSKYVLEIVDELFSNLKKCKSKNAIETIISEYQQKFAIKMTKIEAHCTKHLQIEKTVCTEKDESIREKLSKPERKNSNENEYVPLPCNSG